MQISFLSEDKVDAETRIIKLKLACRSLCPPFPTTGLNRQGIKMRIDAKNNAINILPTKATTSKIFYSIGWPLGRVKIVLACPRPFSVSGCAKTNKQGRHFVAQNRRRWWQQCFGRDLWIDINILISCTFGSHEEPFTRYTLFPFSRN
jgi:hypothetical protein